MTQVGIEGRVLTAKLGFRRFWKRIAFAMLLTAAMLLNTVAADASSECGPHSAISQSSEQLSRLDASNHFGHQLNQHGPLRLAKITCCMSACSSCAEPQAYPAMIVNWQFATLDYPTNASRLVGLNVSPLIGPPRNLL
jgi:hypothetical protein